MNQNIVIEFLLKAKKETYAGGGAESESSRPASHDLRYSEGDLLYIDSYLGSSEFAGQEALWKEDKPFWAMNYIGRVVDEGFSGDFLKEALRHVNADAPYRGPTEYSNGDHTYRCQVMGDFDWFSGTEELYYKDTKVMDLIFHGGKIS